MSGTRVRGFGSVDIQAIRIAIARMFRMLFQLLSDRFLSEQATRLLSTLQALQAAVRSELGTDSVDR
jgi:hypothetical protein